MCVIPNALEKFHVLDFGLTKLPPISGSELCIRLHVLTKKEKVHKSGYANLVRAKSLRLLTWSSGESDVGLVAKRHLKIDVKK